MYAEATKSKRDLSNLRKSFQICAKPLKYTHKSANLRTSLQIYVKSKIFSVGQVFLERICKI